MSPALVTLCRMNTHLIDTASTALVVIDLQKGIVGMPTQPLEAGAVVANAVKLAEAFRERRMPVFLVKVTPSPDLKDSLKPIADVPILWSAGQKTDWSEIVPELGPFPGDLVITKRQWGAFYGTELDLQLRRRKVETIVLCGIATNIGVESTARFAYEYGYQQVFVEDAMAARSRAEHEHTVTIIFPRLGRVRRTADVLEALEPKLA
jgi:nicotinamidase-related amidase